jgi:adenylylsulfate kinase-like enzyme
MIINILGHAGEGRTTVAYAIAKLLKEHGIKCEVVDDETHSEEELAHLQPKRMAAIAGRKIEVKIQTIQERRFIFKP